MMRIRALQRALSLSVMRLVKLPGSITGDAATVGGKSASDFLPVSGGNPTGVINFNVNANARIVLPVGTDKWLRRW